MTQPGRNRVDGVLQGYLDDLLIGDFAADSDTAVSERYLEPTGPSRLQQATDIPPEAQQTLSPQEALQRKLQRKDGKPSFLARFADDETEPKTIPSAFMPLLVEVETRVEEIPVATQEISTPTEQPVQPAPLMEEKVNPIVAESVIEPAPEPLPAPAVESDSDTASIAVSVNALADLPECVPLPSEPAPLASESESLPLIRQKDDDPELAVSAADTASTQPMQSTGPLNWHSGGGVDCLIFTVCGLKLAIPLPMLGGGRRVSRRVVPLFGQASWSLGVWQGDKSKLTIIDSAQLMMPERKRSLQDEGYEYFIQLDRSPWAVACQQICDTVKLDQDAIKWRGETSKRPWLAGTVIDEMCALIDVPGLMPLLEQQCRPARQHTS